MKVTLLASTPDALDVLLFTKNTRLTMNGTTLDEIRGWPTLRKMDELRKMKNTVQSSWEFVDYVFAIEDVTRAFTHQFVRQRVGTSFAQQSMRAVDMVGFKYLATGALAQDGIRREGHVIEEEIMDVADNPEQAAYAEAMSDINWAYVALVEKGINVQDARGLLPTNVLTNITFKANLRTLHEMALKRLCVRTQGEFQDVMWAMIDAVVAVHPWAEPFFRVQCAWNGTCLYPLLPNDQCHVKPNVYNPETGYRYDERMTLGQMDRPATTSEIYQLHRAKRGDVQPIVSR